MKDRRVGRCEKNASPTGIPVENEEMIQILEELIRDPDTNLSAKCTAIRTVREIAPEPPMPATWRTSRDSRRGFRGAGQARRRIHDSVRYEALYSGGPTRAQPRASGCPGAS